MATVGTEDSNLVFQFNSPVNRPVPACYYEDDRTLSSQQEDAEPLHPTEQQSLLSCASTRNVLEDARIFSQYNNYLNDKWGTPTRTSPKQREQEQLLQDRRLKLEELVDKFWLKDGEIDESIFEDSSDEEGL